MRIRANSAFAKLATEQCEQIFEWIASGVTYRDVQERCAQPPPAGFDFRVSLDALWNFYTSERRRRHAEQLAETRYNELAVDNPEQLLQNVKVELAHACYDLARQTDSGSINSLSRISHRLELLRLEQQRLVLERDFLAEKKRQFNFNAAKQAAIHALEIKTVLQDKTIDTEAKVWKVSEIVFGPPLNQQPCGSRGDEAPTHYPHNVPE